MITRLQIENFRSIRAIDLPLNRLNVLIGRNGAGKSNLLKFFHMLGAAAQSDLNTTLMNQMYGFAMTRHLNAASTEGIGWTITFDSEESESLDYEVRLRLWGTAGYTIESEQLSRPPAPGHKKPYHFLKVRDGRIVMLTTNDDQDETRHAEGFDQEFAIAEIRNPARYGAIAEIRNQMRDWFVFTGFGKAELDMVRSAQVLNRVTPLRLNPDGSNIVSVLHELANQPRYEAVYERINNIFMEIFPEFKKFDLPLVAGAQSGISMRSQHLTVSVPSLLMSDGQLRFLGLILLLLLPDPPSLLLIDEPEIGMHPKMVTMLGELLKDAAQRTQIIVATHSPDLIDALGLDDLLIVEQEEGNTTFHRPDLERLANWKTRYSPGYLWTHTSLLGT